MERRSSLLHGATGDELMNIKKENRGFRPYLRVTNPLETRGGTCK